MTSLRGKGKGEGPSVKEIPDLRGRDSGRQCNEDEAYAKSPKDYGEASGERNALKKTLCFND